MSLIGGLLIGSRLTGLHNDASDKKEGSCSSVSASFAVAWRIRALQWVEACACSGRSGDVKYLNQVDG